MRFTFICIIKRTSIKVHKKDETVKFWRSDSYCQLTALISAQLADRHSSQKVGRLVFEPAMSELQV